MSGKGEVVCVSAGKEWKGRVRMGKSVREGERERESVCGGKVNWEYYDMKNLAG